MVANSKEPTINAHNGFLYIQDQMPFFIPAVKLNIFAYLNGSLIKGISKFIVAFFSLIIVSLAEVRKSSIF
ncbi:MAG: hypothetical protein MZU91_03780 [Desulfosudis oleivorans]|nr:hypothetical protein [Desulfosudis oleivorans]